MNFIVRIANIFVIFISIFIASCALNTRTIPENYSTTNVERKFPEYKTEFRGRIALKIEAEARAESAQPQLFSGGFELVGDVQASTLTLYTPLGGTAAVLTWLPGEARMEAAGQTRYFSSLPEMLQTATGAALPVASLFAWLQGVNANEPGWRIDLSQYCSESHRSTATNPP